MESRNLFYGKIVGENLYEMSKPIFRQKITNILYERSPAIFFNSMLNVSEFGHSFANTKLSMQRQIHDDMVRRLGVTFTASLHSCTIQLHVEHAFNALQAE